MGLDEMEGAGNFVMVADPATFRVLPWANATGWVLCDIYFPNGKPVPFSTRALYRNALGKLAAAGFDYLAGLEVEFQLFKLIDPKLAAEGLTWPAEAPAVEHTTHGFQYLTEARFDQVDPILEMLRKTVQALGMPLRSLEVELGPSQYEYTFAPERGMAAADTMVLFRSAMKQAARRHGYLVELHVPAAAAQHLRQRLASASVAARSQDREEPVRHGRQTALLSPLGENFLGGLLAHAGAAAAFTTPTINGYKRYHGVNSMAPVRAIWAHDNRGVMIRALGAPGDPSTHLENRAGEPLANPYLYMASQIHSGSTVSRVSSIPGRRPRNLTRLVGAAAEVARRGARCTQEQHVLSRRLGRYVCRLLSSHQGGGNRALRCRDRRPLRRCRGGHRLGTQRIFRSCVRHAGPEPRAVRPVE